MIMCIKKRTMNYLETRFPLTMLSQDYEISMKMRFGVHTLGYESVWRHLELVLEYTHSFLNSCFYAFFWFGVHIFSSEFVMGYTNSFLNLFGVHRLHCQLTQ